MTQPHATVSAPTAILRVENLRKSYDERLILDIPHLEIHSGEANLLIGRNGAGKSTLLRILAGLEKAQAGTLIYQSTTIKGNVQKTLSGKVIYLHQQPYLFDCSVKDNIAYGLRSQKITPAVRQQRVTQALEWSGLEHLSERHAQTLSGGEKQRIALARAWVLQPTLLLLDEPTANMDSESREKTYFLIRRLINEGMGILMASHGFKYDHPLLTRVLHLENTQLSEQPMREQFAGATGSTQSSSLRGIR